VVEQDVVEPKAAAIVIAVVRAVEPAEAIGWAVRVVNLVELATVVNLVELATVVIPVEAATVAMPVEAATVAMPVTVKGESGEAPGVGLTWLLWCKDRLNGQTFAFFKKSSRCRLRAHSSNIVLPFK